MQKSNFNRGIEALTTKIHLKLLLSVVKEEKKNFYEEIFEVNILIVRKAGSGKTFFIQKIGANKLFGDFKKAKWLSHIELSNSREAQINFNCPSSVNKLDELLQHFKKNSAERNDSTTRSDNK